MADKSVAIELLLKAKDGASSIVDKVGNGFRNLSNVVLGLVGIFGRLASATFGFELPGLSDSTKAAEALEVQLGKLRAAVAATGGAAGLTAEELDAMARRLDEATLGSAAGFRDAQIELLTFKSVGVDAFERTLIAAQDLSEAGFGEVQKTVVQLGKALEDPVKGLTSLTRVGVSFTEEQKDMIENFVKLGDVASAQNVILAAVEGQVKGIASAAGGGLAGAVDLVGKRMTDLRETIGGVLLPILTTLNTAWANVIGAVEKTASSLSSVLKEGAEKASGAINSLAAGIGEFLSGAVQALADWVANLDWSTVQAAADATKEKIAQLGTALSEMGDTGAKVVAVLTIGFNGLQAGFRTLSSGLLSITSSVVSALAAVEEQASKIGLGSMERAKELRETANNLSGAANELLSKVAENGDAIKRSYDTLIGVTDAAADSQKRLKDALPVAELQTLNKSLADYAGIAERANLAAEQAQSAFFAGKISMEQLAEAADAAALASEDLTAAQAADAVATTKADTARKAAQPTLKQAAENARDLADSQSDYTGALEQASNATSDAIQAEIDLALAKGDVATAAAKSVQLAQSEAEWSQRIAAAKANEANELQKVVVAQQAYLDAVGGGTAAQQQELQILQLKVGVLQSEAAQANATAQVKALAAQQTQQNTEETKNNTEETEHHIVALKKDSEEQQVNTNHTNDGSVAVAGLAARLQDLRDEMDKLSESARLYFESQNQWNLSRVGIEGAARAAREAEAAFQSIGDAASKALASYNKEIAFAQKGIDQWREKLGFATTGFEKFEAAMELAALQTKKLWNEQARDAEIARQSIERMTESGNIQMGILKQAIQGVNGGFTLLDQQDLSNLQSAIDAANNKLREMQQEAEDARVNIARLNAEIAAERGETEKAAILKQQLEYQQALAEIEAKRNQATLEGNRELVALYDEQIRKLNELNALKEKNIKADARSNATSSSSSTANSSQPAAQLPSGTGAAALPTTTAGGGITVNVNAGNARVIDNNFVEDLARQMQPTLARLTRLNS